jgi:signal peptidase II
MRADIAGWCRALGVCVAVMLVDQVSKAIVTSSIAVNHSEALILGFKLTNTSNTGLAFGLGQGHGIVLAVTIAALALVLVWFALDPTRPGLWLAVGLLAGGALGNLADRVREHAVTDFIDPPFWATFNLADVAITLGAVVLVLSTIGPEAEGEADRGRA